MSGYPLYDLRRRISADEVEDVRQMFEEYLAKGYRAVDFVLQRDAGFGRYLLAKEQSG